MLNTYLEMAYYFGSTEHLQGPLIPFMALNMGLDTLASGKQIWK